MKRSTFVIAVLVTILMLVPSVLPATNTPPSQETTVMLNKDPAYYEYHSRYSPLANARTSPASFNDEDQERSDSEIINTPILDGPAPLDLMDSPWPMASHDLRHTGRSPFNTTQNPDGVEKWRYPMGEVWGGIAVDDKGVIYVGDSHSNFYAVNSDCTLKWKIVLSLGHPIEITPAIDENGIVYIGTIWASPNYLWAIYSNNGSMKWRYSTGHHIDSSPAVGEDGTIYFGDWNGWFHALNPNGTVKWQYLTGDIITGSPAIGSDGTIYIGSHDSKLYAFDTEGTVKWTFGTGNWVRVSPCIGDDGTVYCVSIDGNLYAIYPNNGTKKWQVYVDAGTNPTIGPDDTIYAGWNTLYAVNPDGSVKWTLPLDGQMEGSTPCTSREGIIYFGTTHNKLYAVNPDGAVRWMNNYSWSQSAPAIDQNGTLYIGANNCLRAFGAGPLKAEAYGPYYGTVNETNIQFNSSGFGGHPPYTFYWDFGDNHTASGQYPTHTYSDVGNFNVTLTVHDDAGNETTGHTTANITYPGPTIKFITQNGIYFFGRRIIPTLARVWAFGPITIEVYANQTPCGISHVDFYDNAKIGTDYEAPYTCYIKGPLRPYRDTHAIVAYAYDNQGKSAKAYYLFITKFF